MLWCETLQQAVDHMRACATEATHPAVTSAMREEDAAAACQEETVRYLASLWGSEAHEVEFMLATRPLHSLARVNSTEGWERLVRETTGLVHHDLLFAAIQWLQDGGEQLELGL